ncbi:amino acid permease [Solihabitans fulvus]|uniref:amino acid permease n=1 Tax=Solihabitans fulvus TaxID=1892852 RepID=UPI001CB7675F|nr:amino acid permease [Solihabitans fulvus]
MLGRLLRTKPVEQLSSDGEHSALRRSLGLLPLIALSVGATLGTGIFVVLGAAAPKAGPAVVVSFVLAALAALFSALSYAELAGAVPVSGSAYSYTYATLGELVAWICGWCLLLEYGVSVAAVAVGWSGYLNAFLDSTIGWHLPAALSNAPGVAGGVVNLPAAVVVLLATAVLLGGVRESAAVTTVTTLLKVAVLVFFVVVAVFGFRTQNLTPFAPAGLAGITGAASVVFFSFIGFDAASTAGEEARNPQRDLPRAIIISLVVVTLAYVLVAFTAVGAVGVDTLGRSNASLATVLAKVTGAGWPATVLAAGAVIAIASVVLTVLYGQTRILVAMSRDRLVPPVFARVGRRRVPTVNTLVVGGIVAVLAALVPLGQLAEATSIGTLVAFGLVNVGVLVLRRTKPGLRRSFRTPLVPFVPLLGLALCVLLVLGLAPVTWLAFGIWSVVGLVIYFSYGARRSALNERPSTTTPDS